MSLENVRAMDVMSAEVHVVREDMDVREAMGLFRDEGISGAPVVDAKGALLGVISQTDIVTYYLSRDDELTVETDYYHRAHLGASRWPGGFEMMDTNVPRVHELMSPVVISARADAPLEDLARVMVEKHVHRVIVTGPEGVAGVVSALDVLRACLA